MGMCRVNGPEALPLRPAGLEKLGQATRNICEAGWMYADACKSDYGQRVPSTQKDPEDPRAKVVGQNVILDLDTLHFVRHCEVIDHHLRTRAEEGERVNRVKARRKLKKQSKKLLKKFGIKYE